MTSLALYPSHNSKGKHDGDYFRELARRWALKHGGRAHVIDIGPNVSKAERFRQVVAAIEQDRPDVVAFFCHGLRHCLPQFGVASIDLPSLMIPKRNVDVLAAAIAANATHPRVPLFACLAGEDMEPGEDGPPGGDGGFADQLRDSLIKCGAYGARVDAHGSSSQQDNRPRDLGGDAVKNPYVRRFEGPEDKDHIGGEWLVPFRGEPGYDAPTWMRWDSWLERGGWLEFPMLTVAEIRTRLAV